MPVKHGQGQTTSWYHLCFIPTSSDSSDDSDIESVVLTPSNPTQTSSTWQELSPPPSPPDWEPEFDLSLPPPPPPPPLFLQPQPLQRASARTFDIEVVQQDRQHQQPPSPSNVFEGDQSSDCSMNGIISRVRVSETDKLSHCPICMDEFKVGGEQACRLPCNHTYCSECILRWLNSSKTCPVCRLQLNGYSFDSTTGNNGLDSEPEILPPPPPPPVAYNGSTWDYFFPPDAPSVAHNAGVETDEADYDSASDELGDPHEDGASQSAPAPPLT